LDTDGDGTVTREEMAAEVERTFAGYDRNQDGKLLADEYGGPGGVRSAMGGFVKQHAQEIDADGDGAITGGELQGIALRMFDKADPNRDGKLASDEVKTP
jgi:Ca2+-binding EF-hand superfamily protein